MTVVRVNWTIIVLSLLCATLGGSFVTAARAHGLSIVSSENEALSIYGHARDELAAMGLTIPRNVPLMYRTRDELMVENNGSGGRAIELDGFYRAYNPEEIWVVSGLPRDRTLGVMAHELTHAWQTTNCPLQDRKLHEGFACWIQYKILLRDRYEEQASRLTQVRDDDYGGGLRALLDVEKRQGVEAVMEIARTRRDI